MAGHLQHRDGEHRVSEGGPSDRTGDLAADHRPRFGKAVPAAEYPVRGGDDRVEVRASGRCEDQDEHGQAGPGELGKQPPPGCTGHALAGLAARMIAECIAGAASWVKVTVASVNPAAASPSRYSVRDRAPAMQPT
jgi:hypothetical protein